MEEAILNEIYQELYAIRSALQSMDIRSELSGVRQELRQINAQLAGLNRAAGVQVENPADMKDNPKKGMFGFLR